MSLSFGSPSPAPSTSFSFGSSSTPAPAPASTGVSFGSSAAPAPTPPTGFSFAGSTPAAPAAPTPSTGAFSFGASSTTPTPAPAFGGTPAPTGTFAFGSTTATTPAPTATSLFGAAPAAPAPSFGGFGSPAPAPFGAPAAPYAAQQAAPAAPITVSGNTPYSSLPPDVKKAIDTIHEAMMKHKRTISNLQTMAPKLLLSNKRKEADFAAGSPDRQSIPSLAATLVELQAQLTALEQETLQQAPQAEHLKSQFEHLTKQAIMFGKWPVEALAVRRGVRLTQPPPQQATSAGGTPNDANANKSKETKAKLEEILDRQMAHVDGIERMPSPYLWQVLQDMENRLQSVANQVDALDKMRQRASLADHSNTTSVVSTVQSQHQAICRVSAGIVNLHAQVEQLRRQYRYVEKGENVLDKANYQEQEKLRKLDDQIRMQYVKAAAAAQPRPTAAAPAPGLFGATPAPSTNLFGQSGAAPAPSLFGAKAPAPSLFGQAPAPSLFGATPPPPAFGAAAPAPLFGQTPAAPAPAFGAAPAPAFGATTPAPAFGGATPAPPAFGATAPAPAFGAPAPAQPAFGATAPAAPAFGAAPAAPAFGAAPAPTFGFSANKTSSSATTPKSKNKSRSGRRR